MPIAMTKTEIIAQVNKIKRLIASDGPEKRDTFQVLEEVDRIAATVLSADVYESKIAPLSYVSGLIGQGYKLMSQDSRGRAKEVGIVETREEAEEICLSVNARGELMSIAYKYMETLHANDEYRACIQRVILQTGVNR